MQTNIVKPILLTLLITLLAFNPLLAQKKGKGKSAKKGQAATSPQNNLKAQALFFDGITAKMKEDYETAMAIFKQVLQINPKHDAAMYELAKMYFDERDKEQAMTYAKGAVNIDPNNKWYQFLYAEVLAQNNQYLEAAGVYQQLVTKYPSDYDYYFDLGYMLIKAGKYEDAIKAYNKVEDKIGVTENISIQKQRLYIQLDDVESAAKELQKLIDAYPQNVEYYQMLAELYEANDMDDEAFALYQKMVEIDSDNPYGRLALADYYLKQGKEGQYFDELKKAFEHTELSLETKARILTDYIKLMAEDKQKRDEAFELIEIIVKTHDDEALAHVLYGDLLYIDGDKDASLEEFHKAATLDNNMFRAWQQVLLIQFETAKYDDLITMSDEVISLFPNQATPYYFKGLAHTQLDHHEDAIKSLKRGAMVAADDRNLKAQMYSLIGEAYNSLEEYNDSDKYYDKALKEKPDDATVLNNYSYFLSVREDELAKAAEMSQKANELEANNSSFQDTYGWILYKQKEYETARTWLEKAMSNGGANSAVIVDHYGDVLFQLDDIEGAVENWQKAKDLGLKSDVIDKKIRDRKVY